MSEAETTQITSKPTLRSKILQHKKPLLAAGALVGGGLLALKFINATNLIKIDLVQLLDNGWDLVVHRNDLFVVDQSGKKLYVVQYIEPLEGVDNGPKIDWREVEQIGLCQDHGGEEEGWICLLMLVKATVRHTRYFVCKEV